MPKQIVAVDWSGAKRNSERKIWVAVVREGSLRSLECGRDRERTAATLLDLVQTEPESVIGLDFAFSFPEWFVREKGCRSARQFWEVVAAVGESWISPISTPFFTKGKWKNQASSHHDCCRRTDREVAGNPESVFKLVGPKQVGRGSLRGMPHLRALQAAGCHIWPFDPVGFPLVVEVFPRALYGRVRKSSGDARSYYLRREFPNRLGNLRKSAVGSDDAFDAATAALVMDRHRDSLLDLPRGRESYRIEGEDLGSEPDLKVRQ